jgi:hypothetical protein
MPVKDKLLIKPDDKRRLRMVQEPARFLYETGLLYQINRVVLHPFGYALAVSVDKKGVMVLAGIIDYSDKPHGAAYNVESYNEGRANFKKFWIEVGKRRIDIRKQALGYIQQTTRG